MVDVLNLATGQAVRYMGLTPVEAVMSAHAQDAGNFNTWEYRERYQRDVVHNLRTVRCGDWTAMKK